MLLKKLSENNEIEQLPYVCKKVELELSKLL